MANSVRTRQDFQTECTSEHDTAIYRLAVRYSRDPGRRHETERPVNDTEKTSLQNARERAVFCEFSERWNGRRGEQP